MFTKYETEVNSDISHSYLAAIDETDLALVTIKSELIISNRPLNLVTEAKKSIGR